MTPRILTASLFATALAAAPLAAQDTTNEDDVIIVPVEQAGQTTGTGMGGFTATQGLAVAGTVLLLGLAVGAGGGGDDDGGSSNGTQ